MLHQQGRILKITEKLNGINFKFDQERGLRVEQIENKLRSVENKFGSLQETTASRQSQLREQLIKLQRKIEEEHHHVDVQIENKIKELIAIEQKYSYLIEQEVRVIFSFKKGEKRSS